MKLEDMVLDTTQSIEIKARPDKVFPTLLHRFGPANTTPQGPMPMILEARAGGRWYRDRGNGIEHLWGFVQVIKPPVLLELYGPMFMSSPVMNHLEVKLEEIKTGSKVTFRHRAVGLIQPDFRNAKMGWEFWLGEIKKDCE